MTIKIGQRVRDLVDDETAIGVVIDIYMNNYGELPTSMLVVKFSEDEIFDRLPHEVEILAS